MYPPESTNGNGEHAPDATSAVTLPPPDEAAQEELERQRAEDDKKAKAKAKKPKARKKRKYTKKGPNADLIKQLEKLRAKAQRDADNIGAAINHLKKGN